MPNKLGKGSKSKKRVRVDRFGDRYVEPIWQDNVESHWNAMNGMATRPTATGKPQQFKRTMSTDKGSKAYDTWRKGRTAQSATRGRKIVAKASRTPNTRKPKKK